MPAVVRTEDAVGIPAVTMRVEDGTVFVAVRAALTVGVLEGLNGKEADPEVCVTRFESGLTMTPAGEVIRLG